MALLHDDDAIVCSLQLQVKQAKRSEANDGDGDGDGGGDEALVMMLKPGSDVNIRSTVFQLWSEPEMLATGDLIQKCFKEIRGLEGARAQLCEERQSEIKSDRRR